VLIACFTREEPRNLEAARLAELRLLERAYYRRLRDSRILRNHYLYNYGRGNLLIFEVGSVEEMHRHVMLSPMALYQQTTIYPLMAMQALRDLTARMVDRRPS
jgi:muconolactone delta-isomerase